MAVIITIHKNTETLIFDVMESTIMVIMKLEYV